MGRVAAGRPVTPANLMALRECFCLQAQPSIKYPALDSLSLRPDIWTHAQVEVAGVSHSMMVQVEIEMECRVDTGKPGFYTADESTHQRS